MTTTAIVGGSYHEISADPQYQALWGSGLRASKIVASFGGDPVFHTYIERDVREQLLARSDLHQFELALSERARPISIEYETPMHSAHFTRPEKETDLAVSALNVLAFGMLEASWTVDASRVVIDPQHSDVRGVLQAVHADHVALVLNEHEARIAANTDGIEQAADILLALGVDVVVIKCGASGGYLASVDGLSRFGVIPTQKVEPLGSGDAFSAGFFQSWALEGKDPVDACDFATAVAAAHSLTGASAFAPPILESLGPPQLSNLTETASVYLAAPFFDAGERMLMRAARDGLAQIGISSFVPLDQIGSGGDEVALADLEGLRSCSSLLGLFPGSDPGTMFEVGWATHAGIPVVGYSEDPGAHDWTMVRGTGGLITSDFSTAIYHAAWRALGLRVPL